ncbi:uncharacterized protein CDAR_584121 [Caerostris darwini]|uniref:Uncharacterized protein n=1 Tax=Caerostris darwini TaxID=1538125 RepID=A0AAV4W8Z5_9ARAC|nr:uncharacterized protein CDAR_584121 [Caerostris darwini]
MTDTSAANSVPSSFVRRIDHEGPRAGTKCDGGEAPKRHNHRNRLNSFLCSWPQAPPLPRIGRVVRTARPMLRREPRLGEHEGRALDEQSRTALNTELSDQTRTVLVAVFFGVAHELGLSPSPTIEGAR